MLAARTPFDDSSCCGRSSNDLWAEAVSYATRQGQGVAAVSGSRRHKAVRTVKPQVRLPVPLSRVCVSLVLDCACTAAGTMCVWVGNSSHPAAVRHKPIAFPRQANGP